MLALISAQDRKRERCYTTRLFIVADDFTGALDTGVQLSAHGARTRVIMGPEADLSLAAPDADVLVLDAETRHLPQAEAGRIVGQAVSRAVDLGISCIYKKTDSALRGNIGAELEAVMKATGVNQLPFLPAFPRMARVTRNGKHYIDGIPVNESVFGQDPFEPVRHADVATLIGEQSEVPVVSLSAGTASEADGILVYDAASDEELRETGIMLQQAGGLSVTAGCAGFGAVLAGLLGLNGKQAPLPRLSGHFLMLCGSVNPITLRQIRIAEGNGFVRLALQPEEKLMPNFFRCPEGREKMVGIRHMLEENPRLIIDANDTYGDDLTQQYAEMHGLTSDEIRIRIAENLGAIMDSLFDNPALGTLLITGGDTLMACMKAVGIHEMEPLGELFPGVVLSCFTHLGHTRHVISKSGGFGEPDLLVKIAAHLSRQMEKKEGGSSFSMLEGELVPHAI